VLLSLLVLVSSSISNYGYFGFAKVVYGQSNPNQVNSNTTSSVNIQDIPVKKIHVGDIDVSYKVFGKGDPILLIAGVGNKMDSWEQSLLKNLFTNHTVIIFDNRGVGNTTTGTKPFSVQQFANDTTGLLEALKIQKADVLGHSMGSYVAQQLIVTHPEKVNRLVLVAASCGGKESIPISPQLQKIFTEMIKNATNNLPISARTLMNLSMSESELKSLPNLLQSIPEHLNYSQFIPIPLNSYKGYFGATLAWESPNWSGVCDKLTKVSSPTLIITGTADNSIPPANSLIIASKIPGAWLVHIKDAGHAVMSEYPDKFNKVLQTFLSTTTTNPG
jgi:pimeloyl-ACP methyl ester carboxylesterase